MQVIPAINETNFEEVKKKIKLAEDFGAEWVQIDVSDGKFTKNILWNKPKDLADLRHTTNDQRLNIEVHLMVKNPDEVLGNWLKAGIKRAVVHIEAAEDVLKMKSQCVAAGAEFGLAINPDTPIENILKYKDDVSFFLILAVNPGLPGQKFRKDQLKKIKFLREVAPNAIIEVDGGVDFKNALLIKKAGADILISASYIWRSKNQKKAYKKLQAV